MGGSTYKPSYQGVGDSLLRADWMVAEMMRRGQRVLDICVATAPVYKGPDDPHRGRYKESFALHGTARGGSKGNRAAAVISNTAPEAMDVECGTSRQEAHHTMRNALYSGAGD